MKHLRLCYNIDTVIQYKEVFSCHFSVRHCELLQEMGTVYFSTKEIAESCADWLHSTGLYA